MKELTNERLNEQMNVVFIAKIIKIRLSGSDH